MFVELHISELPIIYPLLTLARKDFGLPSHSDLDYSLSQIHVAVEEKRAAIFVDSKDNPTFVLVLRVETSALRPGKYCQVSLIYSPRQHRSRDKALKAVSRVISYAKEQGCYVIYGSSWDYAGGSGGIGALWKNSGFEVQETVYMMDLTK